MAQVFVQYGKSHRDADSAVTEIRSNGGIADALSSDLSRPEGASDLAAKVRALAGYNASISKAERIEHQTVTDCDNLFARNGCR